MKRAILSYLFLSCFTTLTAAQEPIIFVVRHAERAESKSESASPNDPGLSEAGRARAAALAMILKDANIIAIYATEYQRTQLTAAPLVQATGLHISIMPSKETTSLIAKLKEAQGNVLVVAHSNTIPEILKGLGVKTPITVGESEYDNLFVVVHGVSPQLIRLHYH